MKLMAISEFKAHALQVISEVAQTQEPVIITKRGKPIAQVVPHREFETKPTPGQLSDTFDFEKDIISPLGEEPWEACR